MSIETIFETFLYAPDFTIVILGGPNPMQDSIPMKNEKHQQAAIEHKITKDMLIGDLVSLYPDAVEPLLEEGVHCIGCGASNFETIEQGLLGHGATEQDVARVIEKLNKAVEENGKNSLNPDSVTITDSAAEKVGELLKKQKKPSEGLRISVVPGGCSGFQYGFEFAERKDKEDNVIEVKGVKFFIDQNSLDMMKGAKIEYVESLQGSGFKISNPNAHGSCGCGKSFS